MYYLIQQSLKIMDVFQMRNLDEQKAGERVNLETYKKNVNDFTLWKPSNNGEPGWESPWGLVDLDGIWNVQ